jgi:hypothetical protein
MPGYRGDYGGAENFGRRNREWDEDDRIDARIRAEYEKKKEYEQNGKFWLKLKDSQRHLPAGPFVGKQSANQAAIDLLKQQPELKGNLVITAYGPDEQVNELSNNTLASYKKKAGADASAADKAGDYKRGDKRFSGIVKATKKQFDNDAKGVAEGRYDSDDYYNPRMSRDYGARNLHTDSGAYEFEKNVPAGEPGGERGRPQKLKGVSKSLPADAFGRTTGKIPAGKTGRIHSMMGDIDEELDENLNKWFKEKWVRFGPDGKIRGDCARGDDSEGKPKCLPQSKAQNLGKEGRASAAARKRREDPNPERSGKAINVNTKKKSNEGVAEGSQSKDDLIDTLNNFDYYTEDSKVYVNDKTGDKIVRVGSNWKHQSGKVGRGAEELGQFLSSKKGVAEGELDEACWKGYHKEGNKKMFGKTYPNCVKNTNEEEQLDEKCWDTHKQVGMKNKGGRQVPNCVPKESIEEAQQCPECGGPMFSDLILSEKKDACYNKVKSRYKVWPSAYASGALVQCRKKGADNWGTGGKKSESAIMRGLVDENRQGDK